MIPDFTVRSLTFLNRRSFAKVRLNDAVWGTSVATWLTCVYQVPGSDLGLGFPDWSYVWFHSVPPGQNITKKISNELNLHLLCIWSSATIMSLFITWYINSIADIASKNNINTVLNITFYLWMVVGTFYGFMCWNCLVSGYDIFVACLWHNYSSFPQINPSRTYPAYAISYLTCPLGHPQIYLFPVLVYFFFTTMLNMLNPG